MKHLTIRIITAFAILVASVMLSLSFALDVSPNEGIVLQKGQIIEISTNDSNIKITSKGHTQRNKPGPDVWDEENIVVNQPKIGNGHVYLRMKSLTMMEGAKIIVRDDIKHLVIEVDTSEFAAGSEIQMLSKYGGTKAPDLTLKVGKSNMKGLKISSIGGNGHNGNNGRNAERKQCSGEDGHPAGNGGNGSNGGDAGKVIIYAHVESPNLSYTTQIKGGKGGQGGRGGKGTNGKECLGGIFRRGGYRQGLNGSNGANGKNTSAMLIFLK